MTGRIGMFFFCCQAKESDTYAWSVGSFAYIFASVQILFKGFQPEAHYHCYMLKCLWQCLVEDFIDRWMLFFQIL